MWKKFQAYIKYFFDRLFSVFLLILLAPLFLLIALAITLDDRHAVFFRQKRPGLHGKPFWIWKFRTMILNADALLDAHGRVKKANRITRVGRALRYLSLDELPQLFNIIKGEMSFIGPRPALWEHLERYSQMQQRRLLMKPGITGLAQVNGRNTLKWSQRIEYDVWYVDHYSLWLDLKILFRTVKVVLLREGVELDRRPEAHDDLGE